MPSKSTTTHFNCPNCNALYQIVKVEAGPETDNREIAWLALFAAHRLRAVMTISFSNIFFSGTHFALIREHGAALSGRNQQQNGPLFQGRALSMMALVARRCFAKTRNTFSAKFGA